MIKSLKIKNSGFTVVEMIISLFILSVAVIGVFSALSVTLVLVANASDRLAGAYLAQEGIEIIRNMRDNNWLSDDVPNWLDGIYDGQGEQKSYEADYNDTALMPLVGGGRALKANPKNELPAFLSYDSGVDTRFRRTITLAPAPDNANAMDVEVEVFWKGKASILGNTEGSITAKETLYNWYQF